MEIFSFSSYLVVYTWLCYIYWAQGKQKHCFPDDNVPGNFWSVSCPEAVRRHWHLWSLAVSSWWYSDPSPLCLERMARPVGDSEAAAWRHPSNKERLPSPSGPIDSCGPQDGLPWDHYARWSILKSFTLRGCLSLCICICATPSLTIM